MIENRHDKAPADASQKKPVHQSIFRRWFRPQTDDNGDALSKWRENILFTVLATALILALAAFIPSIIIGYQEGLRTLIAVDAAVYLGTWFLFIFRSLRYEFRAGAAVLLVYVVGINVCLQVGILSGGPAYIFTSAILAGLLIGLKGAAATVLLNALTVVVLGYLYSHGQFDGQLPYFASPPRALAAGASFILLNAVSAISTAVMVRGLHHTTARQAELTEALYREKADLIATRRELKAENEERRHSEQALRESEAKYRLLAENIHDVIFTLDLELHYTYVSPAVVRLQGWQPHEMIGLNVAATLPERSLELATDTLQAELALAEATGNCNRSTVLEVELLHKDGSTVWGEVTAAFLLDNKGRPSGILGVSRDVSERRKAQQEREELHEQLARSKKMEALGLLAGGVAHDLNNVLSGIVSYPDLLLLDMDEENPLKKPIEAIRKSGLKAEAIVQDLLTLARRGVVTAEALNLNKLIKEHLQSPEHKKIISFNTGIQVHTELETELPNIFGSPVHLKNTLMNLVSNAVEAQPHGGAITITTQSRYLDHPVSGYDHVDAGEYIVFTISDRGEGINAADLPRIFEPFYTKKVMGRSGTGLGMAVVWGTVQDHNGYIDVQSASGKGTCFTLYFPMSRLELQDHPSTVPLDSYKGHGEFILVVDDVEEQRTIAKVLLERLNYRVTAVSSGEKAIAFVQKNAIDLLLLDMIMQPGIDGLDTYRSILVHRPGQKAVIASGFAETSRVKKAMSLGAGPYVKKPYTIDKIGLAVKRALRGDITNAYT